MKEVFGQTNSLKSSDRVELEKLAQKRSNPSSIIAPELLRRASGISVKLGSTLGLLIGRDGRVTHVVLGAKERIYLPDLGRFRLDSARLRRLRLIVFLPPGQHRLSDYSRQDFLFGVYPSDLSSSQFKGSGKSTGAERLSCPEITDDLLADLEKLRLDLVMVVAATLDPSGGPITMAYLCPLGMHNKVSGSSSARPRRGIAFYHARNIFDFELDFESFIKDLEAQFRGTRSEGVDTSRDAAVLVGAYTGSPVEGKYSMDELVELARTAEIQVLDTVSQRRRSLDPKTVIGKGKLEEIVLHCLDLGADLLIFDYELTAGQLRSITNLTELRVIDRSMLILDIFAQRAKTSEGRIQVELAQLKYSLPRLTEKDTGLSRLTGGIGGRGPGETKLEVSRRRARKRISDLEKRIEKIAKQRGLRRERRQLRGVPVIAIVGYTNAGKSTLLNALTKGEVLAEKKLFATLDPSCRRMRFPNDFEVIFVDTVGFIRELPKELVAAFRATLEEVGEADFLLHVVDATNPEFERQIAVVNETLESLSFGQKPRLLLLNKIDLLSVLEVKALERKLETIAVSAHTRSGFPELIQRLQQELSDCFCGQDPGRFTELSSW